MEEEQAAKEVEQEEQIAEVTTDAGEVSIEKKADSIAASEDNDRAAAGREENGGEEDPVKKPKVVFFFLMIQFKLKANTFAGAIRRKKGGGS